MNVSGFSSQRVRPADNSQRAISASNCVEVFHASLCFAARASSTIQPRLWRVDAYSRPGLPRPATSEKNMTQRTFAKCRRVQAPAFRGKYEAYFLAGAAGFA